MNVVMPYCHKDYNLAFYAASVIRHRTDCPMDNFYLYGSQYAPAPPKELRVKYLKCTNDKIDYPMGPNYMFAGLMNMLADGKLGDLVFSAEPDGFPTCKDWYQRVWDGHKKAKRMVSGSLVDWVEPPHINGNAVFDAKFAKSYPVLQRPTVMAWDCHHAELILENGNLNKEILNPRRNVSSYHTGWWFSHKVNGKTPAWIHGCQSFQCWEKIEHEGFPEEKPVIDESFKGKDFVATKAEKKK